MVLKNIFLPEKEIVCYGKELFYLRKIEIKYIHLY